MEMNARIASAFPVAYEPTPMVAYRVHGESLGAHNIVSGENVRAKRQALQIMGAYLSAEQRAQIIPAAMKKASQVGLQQAARFAQLGHKDAALAQVKEALNCD